MTRRKQNEARGKRNCRVIMRKKGNRGRNVSMSDRWSVTDIIISMFRIEKTTTAENREKRATRCWTYKNGSECYLLIEQKPSKAVVSDQPCTKNGYYFSSKFSVIEWLNFPWLSLISIIIWKNNQIINKSYCRNVNDQEQSSQPLVLQCVTDSFYHWKRLIAKKPIRRAYPVQ